MSVENANVVDVVSIDKSGNVVLTVSDHLEWDDNNEHLLILQNKLNAYLGAIENGTLHESYPNAVGRKIVLNVRCKYFPNDDGKEFLSRTKCDLEKAGYGFTYKVCNE